MATTSSLPPNWITVLDEIQRTLTQAIHLAETREAALADPTAAGVSLLASDLLAKHLGGLEERVRHMETPLLALDQTLHIEEEQVRGPLAAVADLRQRLADWAGRAVR